MGGVGAEYYLPHKFSVRFEIESYDADAALFSLNLVKRFGFNSRKTKNKQPRRQCFVSFRAEFSDTQGDMAAQVKREG